MYLVIFDDHTHLNSRIICTNFDFLLLSSILHCHPRRSNRRLEILFPRLILQNLCSHVINDHKAISDPLQGFMSILRFPLKLA